MSLRELIFGKKVCRPLVNAEGEAAKKYSYFQEFLTSNRSALESISELERLYYGGSPFTLVVVKSLFDRLLAATKKLVAALNHLAAGKYGELSRVHEGISSEVAPLFAPRPLPPGGELVLPLTALRPEMVLLAGSKATNLAVIHNLLGAPIPSGFVITTRAWELFLRETGLAEPIAGILAQVSPEQMNYLEEQSRTLRHLVLQAPVPEILAAEILKAYRVLESETQPNVRLAMRSSAVGEDTEASFAGQYATELNVTRENLLEAYKKVLASKYTPRAIAYRIRYGLEDRDALMAVAGIIMIDSRASGVLYTMDPAQPDDPLLKINSIWGLGEHLVSGEASPDAFYVDKQTLKIVRRNIKSKESRLVNRPEGGTALEAVPAAERRKPSLHDDLVLMLADYGLKLEEYFKSPQDAEWAVDQQGQLYLLQSRPLGLTQARPEAEALPQHFPGHPVLLSGGHAASPGIAVGQVFPADADPAQMPDDAILVARTASPEYARFMGRVRGIITDVGSVTSHLASVAREFRVPALFDVGQATGRLHQGDPVTLAAERRTVYQGIIPELAAAARSLKRPIFDSPLHRRLKTLLDKVAVLNLTDPRDPSFSIRGCRTIHDVVRFAHEMVMKEMFGLAQEAADQVVSVKLTTDIPLSLYLIDLGSGLKEGLTTCDTIAADHLESIPLKAIWKGFCHPGITWSGAIPLEAGSLMQLMAQGMLTGPGNLPGGESYAIISREYLNLSAKFGYHFANLDSYCCDNPDQNYITLQFAGGAGTYYGKTLRLNFLGTVLSRLGFKINVSADLLDASLAGYDPGALEETLDQVGRLLASSRLLDLAIHNEAEMNRAIEAFFAGDYDFLRQSQELRLPGFYTHTGNWKRLEEDSRVLLCQDGSEYGGSLTSGMASFMGKVMGHKYLELLDTIEAYFYFPLAIAKDSEVADAALKVRVKPMSGAIDRAGGLAFGIRNINNYFVLRINALEDNVILFEFANGRRLQRVTVNKEIENGKWYQLAVGVAGAAVKGSVDGELLVEYTAERPLNGYVGLWSKADSVTYFADFCIEASGETRVIQF